MGKTSGVLNISTETLKRKRHFQYNFIRDLRYIISQSKYIPYSHISLFPSLIFFLIKSKVAKSSTVFLIQPPKKIYVHDKSSSLIITAKNA